MKNGKVVFFRSDAEQAEWTQEQFSLVCTFPVDSKKPIERGMTVLFKDPATNAWQAYEIRNCQTFISEGYQQFTAEDIAIAELTDYHIPEQIEFTNVTAKGALDKILSGTGWKSGNGNSSGKSDGDIGRGSVWQAVVTIRNNWNVNILPRVTVGANGITGRYLDIVSTGGIWRGLRLSVDKDCSDPCLTYDDSELYTALYAYGASYTEGESLEKQTLKETDISGVTWSKTSDHPAKPSGQKYLEWPDKTKLYGRNGKPRFGYYQNSDIKDPNVLIQKTWETLQSCSDPKISITGTVIDLKRFGYNDVPLRLYDMAIFDFGDTQFYKQIIALTVNLIDPNGNTPTIGDYIPNIIYINRETEEYATGGSTGTRSGRGGGGGSRSEKKQGEFETSILQNERNIILEARQVDENRKKLKAAGIEIDPITGVVIYAEDVKNGLGSVFKVQNNKIEAEVTARTKADEKLTSKITQTADKISLEVSERQKADQSLSSKITMTATKIEAEVKNSESRLNSKITQTATEIRAEVSASEQGLSSRITQTSTAITAEVSRATAAEGNLSSRITVNADNINLKVDKNGVISAINVSPESVDISASKINLSGYVTASDLSTTNAKIDNLTSGVTTASVLRATSFYGTNASLANLSVSDNLSIYGHGTSFKTIVIGTSTYHLLGY